MQKNRRAAFTTLRNITLIKFYILHNIYISMPLSFFTLSLSRLLALALYFLSFPIADCLFSAISFPFALFCSLALRSFTEYTFRLVYSLLSFPMLFFSKEMNKISFFQVFHTTYLVIISQTVDIFYIPFFIIFSNRKTCNGEIFTIF